MAMADLKRYVIVCLGFVNGVGVEGRYDSVVELGGNADVRGDACGEWVAKEYQEASGGEHERVNQSDVRTVDPKADDISYEVEGARCEAVTDLVVHEIDRDRHRVVMTCFLKLTQQQPGTCDEVTYQSLIAWRCRLQRCKQTNGWVAKKRADVTLAGLHLLLSVARIVGRSHKINQHNSLFLRRG